MDGIEAQQAANRLAAEEKKLAAAVAELEVALGGPTPDEQEDVLDMAGYDGVVFVADLSTLLETGTLDVFVEQNTANSTSGMARLATTTAHTTSAIARLTSGSRLSRGSITLRSMPACCCVSFR